MMKWVKILINSNADRILSFIGLAKRANMVLTGEEKVLSAIKSDKAHLVILSGDASERTAKTITDKCKFYKKNLIIFSDRFSLGKFTKKQYAVTLAVTDKNFADKITELYNN